VACSPSPPVRFEGFEAGRREVAATRVLGTSAPAAGPPPRLLHTAGHTSVVDAPLALERAVPPGHV